MDLDNLYSELTLETRAKLALVVLDGVGDIATRGTGYLTPLEAAATPNLDAPIQFIRADSVPTPPRAVNYSNNDFSCAWDMNSFNPPLMGSNYLGSLRFPIPSLALPGQSFVVRFANADGAPDFSTQYNFETLPAFVWIESSALLPPSQISDERKVRFFGSYTNPLAADDADPDGDGVTNLQAYRAGTDPTQLRLLILSQEWQTNLLTGGLKLQWFGAPGQHYTVESTPNPFTTSWRTVSSNLAGFGALVEITDTNLTTASQFYRVRRQP